MVVSSEAFADLMKRARQGDESALAELIRLYEPDLRVAARVLLGPDLRPYLDPSDLVQSVHGSLVRQLGQDDLDVSSPQKLLARAIKMMQNKVAHHWRDVKRQQRSVKGADGPCPVEAFLLSVHNPGDDPAQAALLGDEVRHLLDSLTPDERLLMELRLEGYSTAEIAGQLGVNADVLRVNLSRLRQRLKDRGILSDWL